MRKILIVRHATAEPERYPVPDFDRNLTETGMEEARKLGTYLHTLHLMPELVYHSSANRTSQTLKFALEAGGFTGVRTESLPSLYNCNYQTLLNQIRISPADCPFIGLVGHNPAISQLASLLCSQSSFQLTPGSAVCLTFTSESWQHISGSTGTEIGYFIP